jgi:hypothetical protein
VKWKKAIQFLRDADKTKQGSMKVASNLKNGFYKYEIGWVRREERREERGGERI